MAVSPVGRVSYPSVFEKRAFGDGEPRFEITLIFDEGTDLSVIEDAVAETAKAKWGTTPPKKLKRPIRDGDEKDDAAYEGRKFCTFRTQRPVQVVGPDVKPIGEDLFYAGCFARVSFTAFAFDRTENKGVSLGLSSVQKVRDGEPLAGREKAEDVFDAVEVAEAASFFE